MEPDRVLDEMITYDFKNPITTLISLDESDDDSDSQNIRKDANEDLLATVDNRSLPTIDMELPVSLELDYGMINIVGSNPPVKINNDTQTNAAQANNSQNIKNVYQTNLQKSLTDINLNSSSLTEKGPPPNYESATANEVNFDDRLSKITAVYVKELFNIVSEYLILILKAYYSYKNIQHNSAYNKDYIDKARKYYMDFKEHHFYLCYSTLKVLFLPEYKNDTFNQAFLKRTHKTAHNRGFFCSYSHLNGIYSEMLYWLTTKIHTHLPLFYMEQPLSRQSEELNKQKKTKSRPANRVSKSSHSKEPQLQRIFSAGPAGREIHINVNESHLQNMPNSNCQTTYSTPLSSQMQNNKSNNNCNNYNFSTSGKEMELRRKLQDKNVTQNSSIFLPNTVFSWPNTQNTNQPSLENISIQISNLEDPIIQAHLKKWQQGSKTDQSNVTSTDSRNGGMTSLSNFKPVTELPHTTNTEQGRLSSSQQPPPPREIGMCNTCKTSTYTQCGHCYKTYYCNVNCQSADWLFHKDICTSSISR